MHLPSPTPLDIHVDIFGKRSRCGGGGGKKREARSRCGGRGAKGKRRRKRRLETDTGKIERVAERSERRMTPKGNLGATSMYHGS